MSQGRFSEVIFELQRGTPGSEKRLLVERTRSVNAGRNCKALVNVISKECRDACEQWTKQRETRPVAGTGSRASLGI